MEGKMKIIHYGFMLSLLGVIACDPLTVAFGGAAIVGTTAVRNEKGVIGSLSDGKLQTHINQHLYVKDRNIFDRTELCVKHGMVGVIGYFNNETQRVKAMALVKEVADARDVFDETKVQPKPTAREYFSDSNITSRIKSALALDSNVQSLNYDVTTVKGIVYICGTAHSKFERDVVLHNARVTSGVKQVLAYVRLAKQNN
jgi:osmotically-inducible protein OsmY